MVPFRFHLRFPKFVDCLGYAKSLRWMSDLALAGTHEERWAAQPLSVPGCSRRNLVLLATWWLHGPTKEKPRYLFDSGVFFTDLVPER